jgi:hypothetical protein
MDRASSSGRRRAVRNAASRAKGAHRSRGRDCADPSRALSPRQRRSADDRALSVVPRTSHAGIRHDAAALHRGLWPSGSPCGPWRRLVQAQRRGRVARIHRHRRGHAFFGADRCVRRRVVLFAGHSDALCARIAPVASFAGDVVGGVKPSAAAPAPDALDVGSSHDLGGRMHGEHRGEGGGERRGRRAAGVAQWRMADGMGRRRWARRPQAVHPARRRSSM